MFFRILLILSTSCLLLTSNSSFPVEKESSDQEIAMWFTYYYQNPQPDELVKTFKTAIQRSFIPEKKAPNFFGFLSGIFDQNPQHVEKWLEELVTAAKIEPSVLILALWYSKTPKRLQLLESLKPRFPNERSLFEKLTGDPIAILDIPLEQAWALDTLWGYFWATGSDEPVLRIISTLQWINIKDHPEKLVVGKSAEWSLTSNAIQHERVLDICKKQAPLQVKAIKPILLKIIADAEAEKSGKAKYHTNYNVNAHAV